MSDPHGERMTEWREISTAPKDGSAVWAYLFHSGVRLVEWWTPERVAEHFNDSPEGYEGGWTEPLNPDECWSPSWWIPYDAIPEPPK